MPSLNAGALRALPMTLLGQGSGAINFVRQLGGAFGVNLLSIALERRSQLYVDSFTAAQHAGNSATTGLLRDVTGLLAQAGVPEAIRQAGAMNYLGRMIYAPGQHAGIPRQLLYRRRDLPGRPCSGVDDAPAATAPTSAN